MRETTIEERREIAVAVNSVNPNGKRSNHPQWIDTREELIEQYREYAKQEMLARYDETDPERLVMVEKIATVYADMLARSLEHDMPALTFFFRRYLTQR